MTVDLRETRLPGIGVKYVFRTARGGRLAVILHNDGQREIYYYVHDGDDEPRAVIELHDDEARPCIGLTLAECGFRAKTGITVIAILREPEPISGAQPHHRIERGDTLVTVGKAGQYPAFR